MTHDHTRYPPHLHHRLNKYPPLTCKNCNLTIPIQLRKEPSGRIILISPSKYATRKYCNKTCKLTHQNRLRGYGPTPARIYRTRPHDPLIRNVIPDGIRVGPMPILPTATRGNQPANKNNPKLRKALRDALHTHAPQLLEAFVLNETQGTLDTDHLETPA